MKRFIVKQIIHLCSCRRPIVSYLSWQETIGDEARTKWNKDPNVALVMDEELAITLLERCLKHRRILDVVLAKIFTSITSIEYVLQPVKVIES